MTNITYGVTQTTGSFDSAGSAELIFTFSEELPAPLTIDSLQIRTISGNSGAAAVDKIKRVQSLDNTEYTFPLIAANSRQGLVEVKITGTQAAG